MLLRRPVTVLALCAWMLLTLAEPLAAWARAGGGQGYGGGSGSGGLGGGGGGFFSFWPLLFFGHGSGAGTLIVLLVIYYLYKNYSQRQTGQFGGINPMREAWSPSLDAGVTNDAATGPITVSPPAARLDPGAIATGIAAIKARDPNFDQSAFLDRAQTAFFKVQQAWQARNQDVARDVMSDALYERHKMQTDQLLANHQIDMLENMVIGHATIVAVNATTPYDSIVVAFSASMTDYTIDENTKKIVSGDQGQQTFTERWTFIRRADAKSAAGATMLSSTCPACGAPLSLQNGRCTYCGGYVKTSSSDWVVDSIEQV